jgi:hypothetical protein
MPSDNLTGADNQQERLFLAGWIVGMTDGEGCFSISIFRNKTTRLGWQVMPEYVVTQSGRSYQSLVEIQNYFHCGKIFVNHRYDNHHEVLYRYCVRNRADLKQIIVPFFRKYSLQTAKQTDFERFCQVLDLMDDKYHLTEKGLKHIGSIVGKRWEKESSETTREASLKEKMI